MKQEEPKQWYEKIILLDSSRPQILNLELTPSIQPIDLQNQKFAEGLLRKLKAVSIHLDRDDFAKLKGYRCVEIRGGDFREYYAGETPVLPDVQAGEEFQRFLQEKELVFANGFEYNYNGNEFVRHGERVDEFWLKEKPTLTHLTEIGNVPYVSEVSLFVHYNDHTPAVDHWIVKEE
jgi:hypothetical protein